MADLSTKIFTREDYDKLRGALRDLHDAGLVMDKAEACGIECQALRQMRDEFRDFLESVEKEFMTPPPTERKV